MTDKLMSYADAINILKSSNRFYINLGLENIINALAELGNPQQYIKCIHVAGTNGKGSVCAMLESVLREAGYKTGLYTSPHIWEYTERIKVNGEDIPKYVFAEYVDKICNVKINLTEFEILTVAMFLYFKEQKVDVAILETGLGGRFDATNVIKENLCSIITRIDLDHTDRLGNTKEEIAYEKAGIIKPNSPVFTSMKFDSIREKAQETNAQLTYVEPKVEQKYIDALSLKGQHQNENLALVISVIKHLFKDINEEVLIDGLKKVKHPCRFEYIKDKNIIIDACHNPNGVEALRKNLDEFFPNQKRRFVFGCLKTKDAKSMMNILFREDDEVLLNGFDYPNAYTYEELSEICPVQSRPYISEKELTSDRLNIICGSFYMISTLEMSF